MVGCPKEVNEFLLSEGGCLFWHVPSGLKDGSLLAEVPTQKVAGSIKQNFVPGQQGEIHPPGLGSCLLVLLWNELFQEVMVNKQGCTGWEVCCDPCEIGQVVEKMCGTSIHSEESIGADDTNHL